MPEAAQRERPPAAERPDGYSLARVVYKGKPDRLDALSAARL